VLEAVELTNATLQTWIRRGLVTGAEGDPVDMPGSPGIRRTFSFAQVMQIATAKALIGLGLSVSDAFNAAAAFAHLGSQDRPPGQIFPSGVTLLCVSGDRSVVLGWPQGELLTIALDSLGAPDGFMLLILNPMVQRLTAALARQLETEPAELSPELAP
jgi:hypothetical protein